MASSSSTLSKSIEEIYKSNMVVIKNKNFHKLLNSVREVKEITAFQEVLDLLRTYISEKKLYNPVNPIQINCDDSLSSVFGMPQLTLLDVKKYLPQLVCPIEKCKDADVNNSHQGADEEKIKNDAADGVSKINEKLKKSFENSCDCGEGSLCYDDSDNECIFAVQETYDIEYDIDSSDKNSGSDYSGSSEQSDSDEEMQSIGSTVIHLVCKNDSDKDFWADKSSDEEYNSDLEIEEFDKWKCTKCCKSNRPLSRFCMHCFHTRSEWVSECSSQKKQIREENPRPKRKSKAEKKSKKGKKAAPSSSNLSSSQESQSPPPPLDASKTCLLCCARPINALIVHGKFGHAVCCYTCGRKLQRRKNRCPICRRTIERVVYTLE